MKITRWTAQLDPKKEIILQLFQAEGLDGSGRDSGSGGLGQKDMSAIQRKIASEQVRAQISGASGKSNWEKVSERYSRNKSSFLLGQ